MKRLKLFEEVTIGLLVALLAAITILAILSQPFAQYAAYTFYAVWGVQLAYYMVKLRNYFSLILLGLAGSAGGMLMMILSLNNAHAPMLLGKIALTIFAVILAIHLYKQRTEIGSNNAIFVGLILLLGLQIVLQNVRELDALSPAGFVNYFTVGLIAHILLNGYLSRYLKEGQKAVLITVAIFSLNNISLMLISKFL